MSLDNQNISGADAMMHKLQAIKHYVNNDAPIVIGVEGVKYFKEAFHVERFGTDKWAARKTKRSGSTNGQKILTQTGELSEANDYRVQGNTVIFTNDKPYAQVHNEGANTTQSVGAFARKVNGKVSNVKAHSRNVKMPKRQFMGWSQELEKNITDKITRDLNNITK